MRLALMVITMYNQQITLISESYSKDSIGQHIPTENKKVVFCSIGSISKNEWFDAGRSGLKPEFKVTLPIYNYNNELIAEIDGIRYSIYRTYKGINDIVELYLEKQAGV